MENLSEKTLSLFVKFIMVCEDNISRLNDELKNAQEYKYDCYSSEQYTQDDIDWEEDVLERINHYKLLYKDIKEHTGLTSEIIK